MRISTRSNKTVFVITGAAGGGCPRLLIGSGKTMLRDDYKGSVKTAKNLFSLIVSL